MTKGLLKSTLFTWVFFNLHLWCGDFQKNKRFEIYEIPLDIVDVSENNKQVENQTKIKKVHLKRINTLVQNQSQGLKTLNLLWKKKKRKKKLKKK